MRILAVDDEPIFLDILKLALEQLGHGEVTLAHSALVAQEAIRTAERPFDCLLLDIRMPGMDGIALTAWVRSLDAYRHTPILMVTKMTERHHVEGAFAAGATDYICKPLDTLDLKARIGVAQHICDQHRQGAELRARLASQGDPGALIPFAEPVELPDAERLLRFHAFENYVQALTRTGYLNLTLVGLHVVNGALIHARLPEPAFVDAMTDVALAIGDGLKTVEHQLAYAGAGSFCAALSGRGVSDWDEVALRINFELEQYLDLYEPDLLPMVRIGAPVGMALQFRDRGTGAIRRAIAGAVAPQTAARPAWLASA